jgi:hypothetical protein
MSFKQGRENHLIIPIGMVIDEKNKLVNTNQIDSSTFAKANRFKRDVIDFEYELNSLRHYREITRFTVRIVLMDFMIVKSLIILSLKEIWVKFYVINHLTMF